MNRKIINFVDMLKAVDQFFTEHPELLTNNPALQASVSRVKVFITDFDNLDKAQSEKSSTAFALKAETRTSLTANIQKVYAGIRAHATATNDTVLKLEVDITDTELKRMRDHVLLQEGRSGYELAKPLINDLKMWKITEDDVEALNTNSATFEAKDPAIKNIKSRTAQATEDMKNKQAEVSTFLKDTLDVFIAPFKFSDATLFGQYQKARSVINTAGAHSKPKDNGGMNGKV
jgi:hypothetical protein